MIDVWFAWKLLEKKDVGLIFLKRQAISTCSIQLHIFPYLGPSWTYWPMTGLQRFGGDQLICECHWELLGRGWCRGRGGAGIYFDHHHQHHHHHQLGCLESLHERQFLHVRSSEKSKQWTRRWNWGMWSCSVHFIWKEHPRSLTESRERIKWIKQA